MNMKSIAIIFLGQSLLACLALPAWSQASPAAGDSTGAALFGQPVRASGIIGRAIKNSQDEKLGTVKDLALDLENGRIVEIVVARGGFLGMDQKVVAVPAQEFKVEAGGKTLHTSLEKPKLDGAPAVDLSKWSEAMNQSHVEEMYRYFGATPYFLIPEFPPKQANSPAFVTMNKAEPASRLLRLSTYNDLDEHLGKVEDIMVDIPQGRVVEVIIASGEFLGIKDELSAAPPQALHLSSARDFLRLDVTAGALAAAPHFSARAWPLIDREQAGQVYRAYHVVPYFLPLSLNPAAQNAVQSDAEVVASLDAVGHQADLNVTKHIREDIEKADNLSLDARNIAINTVQGRVYLTGTVADRAEKRRLGRIAARYAIPGRVDNQLQIKLVAASESN